MLRLAHLWTASVAVAHAPGVHISTAIIELFIRRDEDALKMLRHHIDLRLEDATRAVEIAFAHIYMRRQV